MYFAIALIKGQALLPYTLETVQAGSVSVLASLPSVESSAWEW